MVNIYFSKFSTDEDSTEAQLEKEEDILLRQAGCLNKATGCYTEAAMRMQKARRHETPYNDERYGRSGTQRPVLGSPMIKTVIAILEREHCSQRMCKMFKMHLLGYTYREIGDECQTSHGQAHRDVKKAVQIIKMHWPDKTKPPK